MLEISKVSQYVEDRHNALLQTAELRRVLPEKKDAQSLIPSKVAIAAGNMLISLGAKLKEPYETYSQPEINVQSSGHVRA